MATSPAPIPGFNLPSHEGCDSEAPWRNELDLPQYKCNESFFGDVSNPTHPLAIWTGYFVIVGLGVSFGIFTVLLVALEQYLFSTVRWWGGSGVWAVWGGARGGAAAVKCMAFGAVGLTRWRRFAGAQGCWAAGLRGAAAVCYEGTNRRRED